MNRETNQPVGPDTTAVKHEIQFEIDFYSKKMIKNGKKGVNREINQPVDPDLTAVKHEISF